VIPKFPLIQSPTPLHSLNRMSESLGIDLWIKRDDLTGFAFGGNKGRKLEYLLADALAKNATAVVTCGAVQSNFIRQLGAAAKMAGLKCAAVTMALPYEDQIAPAEGRLRIDIGNPTLNRLLDVDIRTHPDAPWETLYAHQEELAREYEAQGESVYRIPIGGSSALGALAFVYAGDEVATQLDSIDWIVTASSSGSTQTGLAMAYHGTQTKVLGISSDPEPELTEDFETLSRKLNAIRPDLPVLTSGDFGLNVDYVGPGYGMPSLEGQAAIKTLAQTEGIFLDPIYSGKAFAGLLDLVKKKEVGGRVVFWHTGGLPTLFAV